MARNISIGNQDFETIIERNCFYIDKTNFIKEWWENGDIVTLITRPRRFGKTLTLNMLEKFFSIKHAGRGDLFEGLSIWNEEKYRQLQGTHPVIFLSFASVKSKSYSVARELLCQLIVNIYQENRFLLKNGFLDGEDAAFFQRVSCNMSDAVFNASLSQLSKYLHAYYGKKAVILLDEYDSPMQEAYVHGYWDELADFIRGLFDAAFKTNSHLERGLLTGITRVSKESIFPDLNHLKVVTTTTEKYETLFGFTEDEVFRALDEYGLSGERLHIKRWYDGFQFGKCGSIYNPWSITNFLDEKTYKTYWVNTSSNILVSDLIRKGGRGIKQMMEDLLQGKTVRTAVDEEIVFDQLNDSDTAVWSLFTASGYLKITGIEEQEDEEEDPKYQLALTNLEVIRMFRKLIRSWFSKSRGAYQDFVQALLQNDVETMNLAMNEISMTTFSSFDAGTKPSVKEPERFYHGFMLGLVVELRSRFVITSNRESCGKRCDVTLEPRNDGDDAIILEFKVQDLKKENGLEDTVQAALAQIVERNYSTDLEYRGIPKERIRIYGFAFCGVEVLVGGGYLVDYALQPFPDV